MNELYPNRLSPASSYSSNPGFSHPPGQASAEEAHSGGIATHSFYLERFRERLEAGPKLSFGIAVYNILLGITVYMGLREIMTTSGASSLERATVPLTVAVASGIIFGVLWHYLFRNLPLIESNKRRSWMFQITLGLTLVQMVFCSLMIVSAIGGNSAVNMHLADNRAAAEISLKENEKAVLAQEGFIGKVETAAAKYYAYSRNEREHGALTGRAGPGKVASAYEAVAARLSANARSMHEQIDIAKSAYADGTVILKQLNDVIHDPKMDSVERQRKYAERLPDLDHVVQTLAAIDVTAQLATRGAIGGIAYGTEVQRPGREDITDLEHSVELFGEDLRNDAKEMRKNADLPQVPSFEVVSIATAVIENADRIWQFWIMAVALDLLPLLILVLWVLHWRDIRTVERDMPAWGVRREIVRSDPPPYPLYSFDHDHRAEQVVRERTASDHSGEHAPPTAPDDHRAPVA